MGWAGLTRPILDPVTKCGLKRVKLESLGKELPIFRVQCIKEINTFYETTRRPGVGNVSGRDGAPCSHDGSAAWVDLTLIYWFGIQIMNTVHLFLDIVTMMG